MAQHYTERFPELKGFLEDLDERYIRSQLPDDKVILDDVDVQRMLKISKRKLVQLRSERQIKYYRTEIGGKGLTSSRGRRSGKIYYLLADVLSYVKRNPVTTISEIKKL